MRNPLIAAALILLGCSSMPVALASSAIDASGAYSVELTDEAGRPLPTYEQGGRSYVLGTLGERYKVHVRNRSSRRIEVVASVDGRDVVDGKTSSFSRRGYLVNPYDDVVLDGFRLNQESVAAFRFSSVPSSYAAQMGSARDVGVIGVAVFVERRPVYTRRPAPLEYRNDGYGSSAPKAEAESQRGADSSEGMAVGPAPAAAPMARKAERSGLGTEFGEEHASHVETTEFERESQSPQTLLSLRYNDRRGLLALGIDVDRRGDRDRDESYLRESANPFRHDPSFSSPPPGWRARN